MINKLMIYISRIVLLSTLSFGLVFSVLAQEINWLDYDDARALKSNKPIFVFGKMRFCGACKKMENEVFTHPELANLINTQFIPVKETINTAFSSFEFDDLKDENGDPLEVEGFPSLLIVEGDKYSLRQGFMTKDKLLNILTKVVEARLSLQSTKIITP